MGETWAEADIQMGLDLCVAGLCPGVVVEEEKEGGVPAPIWCEGGGRRR